MIYNRGRFATGINYNEPIKTVKVASKPKPEVIRVDSLNELDKRGFVVVGHGMRKDAKHFLWSIEKDGDTFLVKRSMDEDGNPICLQAEETTQITASKKKAELSSPELFQAVLDKGIEYDSHENDLYIPKNEVTEQLINDYKFKKNVETFRDNISKTIWYDIPFAYVKQQKKANKITPDMEGTWFDSNRGIYMYGEAQKLAVELGWTGESVLDKDAEYYLEAYEEAENYINTLVPEGYYFGNHPDLGDLGLWKIDDDSIEASKKTAIWKGKLQKQYEDFEEFQGYDRNYGLAERLGFDSAEEAWEANPMIQGGVNPEDYKVIKASKKKATKFDSPSDIDDEELRLWVLNDEGLYNWMQDTYEGKTDDEIDIYEFIENNRGELQNIVFNASKKASKKSALTLWKRPSNYMGEEFNDYYVGPGQSRDSDVLEKANFEAALKMLGGENPPDVIVEHARHWAVGYVEQILVHKDSDKVAILEDIESKLESYPVLDDDLYSNMQHEEYEQDYESWAKSQAIETLELEETEDGRYADEEGYSITEDGLHRIVYDSLSEGYNLRGDDLKKRYDDEKEHKETLRMKELEDLGQQKLPGIANTKKASDEAQEAYNIGVKAGESDGWMVESLEDGEKQLREDLNKADTLSDLLSTWEQGWEQTDHWNIKYGKVLQALRGGEYGEYISDFWEGFHNGLTKRNINLYEIGKKLLGESNITNKKALRKKIAALPDEVKSQLADFMEEEESGIKDYENFLKRLNYLFVGHSIAANAYYDIDKIIRDIIKDERLHGKALVDSYQRSEKYEANAPKKTATIYKVEKEFTSPANPDVLFSANDEVESFKIGEDQYALINAYGQEIPLTTMGLNKLIQDKTLTKIGKKQAGISDELIREIGLTSSGTLSKIISDHLGKDVTTYKEIDEWVQKAYEGVPEAQFLIDYAKKRISSKIGKKQAGNSVWSIPLVYSKTWEGVIPSGQWNQVYSVGSIEDYLEKWKAKESDLVWSDTFDNYYKDFIIYETPTGSLFTVTDKLQASKKALRKKIADEETGESEESEDIPVKVKIVKLDETEYWNKSITEKTGKIYTYYIYDKNEVTHLAEITGSYYLIPIDFETENQLDDELYEEVQNNWQVGTDPMYIHTNQVERMNPKEGDTFDTMEEAEEYYRGNPPYFTANKRKIKTKEGKMEKKSAVEWEKEAVAAELVNHFGEESREDIENTLDLDSGYSNLGDAGTVTIDGTEYSVIKDEDEAENIAMGLVEEDLENEPNLFNQDFLLSHIDEEKAERVFREIYSEWDRSYAEDIKSEDSDDYTNRLAEEMVSTGIITEEEGQDEDFDLDDKIDEFAEQRTQEAIDEGGGGYEYYKFNFGDDEANKIVMDNGLLDITEAKQDAVSQDGFAHYISRYNGDYETTENGLVFFRES